MWSGGISKRNPIKPVGKWAKGLTYQTAETPACHIQFVRHRSFFFFHRSNSPNIETQPGIQIHT